MTETVHQKTTTNDDRTTATTTTPTTWTLLNARLSEPRRDCSAITVQDRYILVMGGAREDEQGAVPLVDIIDTFPSSSSSCSSSTSHRDNNPPHSVDSVRPGPSMRVPRCRFHVGVRNNGQILALGGIHNNYDDDDDDVISPYSMEFLDVSFLQDAVAAAAD
ncbi:hypothetical protein ACA910_019119 [Epithemia clementina (nom. ined.)]